MKKHASLLLAILLAMTLFSCSEPEPTSYTVTFRGIERDPIIVNAGEKLKLSKDFEVKDDALTILKIDGKRVYRNTEIPITGDTVIDVERTVVVNGEGKGHLKYEDASDYMKVRYILNSVNEEHDFIIPDMHDNKYIATISNGNPMDYVRSIQLPDSLKVIASNSFLKSTITEIDLPEGLETIGLTAFNGCKNLKSLVIPSTVTEMKVPIINMCPELKEITVMKKKDDCKSWYSKWYCFDGEHDVTVHYLDGDVIYPKTSANT